MKIETLTDVIDAMKKCSEAISAVLPYRRTVLDDCVEFLKTYAPALETIKADAAFEESAASDGGAGEGEERHQMMLAGLPAMYKRKGDFFVAMALSDEGRLHRIEIERRKKFAKDGTAVVGTYYVDEERKCGIASNNFVMVRKALQAYAENLRKANKRRNAQAKRAKAARASETVDDCQ